MFNLKYKFANFRNFIKLELNILSFLILTFDFSQIQI